MRGGVNTPNVHYNNDVRKLLLRSRNKVYITFVSYFLVIMFRLRKFDKKLELCLTVVSVLLKIRFGHSQINVSKIGIPILKTAFINPLHVFWWRILYISLSH